MNGSIRGRTRRAACALVTMAAFGLCRCATRIETSGSASDFVPTGRLAVATLQTDYMHQLAHGESGETGRWNWRVQNYADRLMKLFDEHFPEHLQHHGIEHVPAGPGTPTLKVQMGSYQINCAEENSCNANIDLLGDLVGGDGRKVWSFSTPIHASQVDADELGRIEEELIARMKQDGVLAAK